MLNENQLNMNMEIFFELYFWKITMLIKNRSRKKLPSFRHKFLSQQSTLILFTTTQLFPVLALNIPTKAKLNLKLFA